MFDKRFKNTDLPSIISCMKILNILLLQLFKVIHAKKLISNRPLDSLNATSTYVYTCARNATNNELYAYSKMISNKYVVYLVIAAKSDFHQEFGGYVEESTPITYINSQCYLIVQQL